MEKIVYLVWGALGEDPREPAARLLEEAAPRLLDLGPRGLSMNLNDAEADVPVAVPWPEDEAPLLAEVSLWLDCYDRREPWEEVLSGHGARRAAYLVTESLYSDYGSNDHAPPRDWPDGKRSPGLLTVTLLERPERLSRADWLAHWHGVQSPVSDAMQPRTRYVRNTVTRALGADAPPYEGIVDEAWPSAAHVTEPDLFYGAGGSPERLLQNQREMFESVRAFLDFDRIRTVTMSEYLLKS